MPFLAPGGLPRVWSAATVSSGWEVAQLEGTLGQHKSLWGGWVGGKRRIMSPSRSTHVMQHVSVSPRTSAAPCNVYDTTCTARCRDCPCALV
eukprot:10393122-Alexandrium_andersonii.AAC.1